MEKKAAAWRGYNQAAIAQMFIELLPELAKAIAGYVYFDAKSRGTATSVEDTTLRAIRR